MSNVRETAPTLDRLLNAITFNETSRIRATKNQQFSSYFSFRYFILFTLDVMTCHFRHIPREPSVEMAWNNENRWIIEIEWIERLFLPTYRDICLFSLAPTLTENYSFLQIAFN